MKNFLSKIPKNANITIFGTTLISKIFYDILQKTRKDINVVCFVDSYKEGMFENINIIKPNELNSKNIDLCIITSISHSKEIATILKNYCYENYLELSESAIAKIKENIIQIADKNYNSNIIKEFVPQGHYYSIIPSEQDLEEHLEVRKKEDCYAGIDLNIEKQLEIFKTSDELFNIDYFPKEKTDNKLYYWNNIFYPLEDAFTLALIMKKYKPKNIIEIGSGFSTAAMLDINNDYFDNNIKITCIEPHPERLKSCLKNKIENIDFYKNKLQEVDLTLFDKLEENDILFIDSSHVAKINSDVLKIFFEILPKLKKNVLIHFHDIFDKFLYHEKWVKEGRIWNEAYFLRAFLQYNNSFKIEYFTNFLKNYVKNNNLIKNNQNPKSQSCGGSFWMRKIA